MYMGFQAGSSQLRILLAGYSFAGFYAQKHTKDSGGGGLDVE